MILKVQLGMVCLVALQIIATDAICTSNESSALHCSHMVTPDITNDTCLNSPIPCCDISTYIKNSSFTSNTTFCFLNGTHIIDLVENPMLRIENVSNISLIGLGSLMHHSLRDKVNEYNFTSYEDDQNITFLQSLSVIECKSPFAFIFSNITDLKLLSITIQNCGTNVTIMPIQGIESFPNISSVAILMIHITNLIFGNTSVQNSTGYGVVGINMLGYSQLVGSSFVGNNQYVKNTQLTKYYYQDILCNDGSCATPSVIYVTTAIDGMIRYPASLGQNNGNESAMISSDATGVFHCVNDSVVFDTPLPISAYPGKKVNISIITIGQLNGASPDIVTYLKCNLMSCPNPNINCGVTNCTSPSLKTTDIQPTHQYCTNYTYLVTEKRNKAYDDVLVRHDIVNDVQTSTVLRNNTIWIGNSSSNTSLAVHLHCPYDYCNPSKHTLQDKVMNKTINATTIAQESYVEDVSPK
ncbi:hypothetical protein EMCRGX_G026656 [Ephydatia muelleri]